MSTETTRREATLWSCNPDAEILTAWDISEAIEQWADEIYPNPLPEEVAVYGFAHMELPSAEHIASTALEDVLEWLDEEHGDPNDFASKPTEAMKAAAIAFAETVRSEYKPWTCEQVTVQTVRVADYYTPEAA